MVVVKEKHDREITEMWEWNILLDQKVWDLTYENRDLKQSQEIIEANFRWEKGEMLETINSLQSENDEIKLLANENQAEVEVKMIEDIEGIKQEQQREMEEIKC